MSTSVNFYSQSLILTPESPKASCTILEAILKNLSCALSSNVLDLVNVGLQIYDPFLLHEPIERHEPLLKISPPRAISLRSKSTRNLNIRRRRKRNLS